MGNDLKDELISLQAIFEDNVEFNDEEKCLSYFNKSNKIVLEAVINEDYPQTLPLISVKNKNSAQIENELRQLCTQKIGFPMLFDLISKFDEMIEKIQSKERTKPSSRAMGSGKSTTSTEESVCSFFLKGSCRFGDNCFNLHPEVMNNSGSNDSTKVSTTIPSETKKIETRSRRTKKEDKVDVSKKPSMKTAMDVINRILWDESLPTENFVVGYLDRFTGIQEKKFEEFSWEDIASVDDHVVFAVPKHRIQYFKYRNVKVWEKSIRMDKVFNSTGDKESLVDIIKIEDESFDSSHVKEETKIDEPCMQRNNPRRPNAFLCIPITCDSIRSKIKKVQEDLLSYDDRLENFLYDVNWLHVTVCMFRLNSDADTKKANTVLVSLQPLLASMLGCYRLKLREVGNFRNLVIYIDVECDLVLEKFVGIAKQRLDKGGISLVGNYDVYHPHVTILKMKPKEYTELNLNGVAFMYKKWQSQIFGEQKVESLKICDTGKSRGLDGFYVTRGVVCNRFCILSTKLGKLLARRIRQLQERSLILEDEADELIDDLLSTDNMERVEKAVEYLTVNHMHNAESGRYVIVLRGLMGSGKSTLAKKIIAGSPAMRVASCSADDYFVKKNIIDESYEFSATEIQQAHQNCRDCFSQLLLEECEMVIVDNCHAQKWEYHFYQHVAALCGYKSHLLEISCPDEATLKKFQHRSVHNVKPEVSLATWKRWEIDNESFRVADTDNFQISDLFERKVSVNLSNVLFAALYLDTASKDLLKKNYHVVHKHVFADHVTLIHKPNVEQLKTIPIGSNHRVKVIGYVIDADVEVVAVKEVSDQLCQMPNPHVTISTRPGVKPVASAKALEITRNWSQPKSELILTGKIGLQIRINKTESKVCFDQCTFKEESSNARTTNISAEKEPSVKTKKKEKCDDEEKVNLYFGTQEKVVEEIYIFDFDSTLFYTPGPVEGRQMYTKYTGEKWAHRGWLGVPQSLYYPLLVYPGPSLRDYHDHSKRPMAMTCMLTGRIERTRAGVEAVLKDHQLLFDRLMLKDDNRLKNVHQYKKEYVKNLLKEFPTAKVLKFWDDREDNVKQIGSLRREFPHLRMHVYNVQTPRKPFYSGDMEEFLTQLGVRPTQKFNAAVEEGMDFLRSVWTSVVGENSVDCFVPFGSYVLGRRGDIDLCILTPRCNSVQSYMQLFAEALRQSGVKYLHCAPTIRCPRIRVRLQFIAAADVEFDITMACVLCKNDTDIDLESLYKNCEDKQSKIALEGTLFFSRLVQPALFSVCLKDFGMIVDLIVFVLRRAHLKENAFHCIRTFHIVKLLACYLSASTSPPNELNTMKDYEMFLKSFFVYLHKIPLAGWNKLFNGFVPDQYIGAYVEFFGKASLQALEEILCYAPKHDKMQNVNIVVQSSDTVAEWKAVNLLEAKFGSCVRKMLDCGMVVQPGSVFGSSIKLYTTPLKQARSFFDNLKTEIEEYVQNVKLKILMSASS